MRIVLITLEVEYTHDLHHHIQVTKDGFYSNYAKSDAITFFFCVQFSLSPDHAIMEISYTLQLSKSDSIRCPTFQTSIL